MTATQAAKPEASQRLTKVTLTEQMVESLLAYILEEGLQDGEPLPSAAELGQRYGVSRTVIREAIAELSARGVVARSQGREAIVVSPGQQELGDLLKVRVAREGVSPEQVMEARRAVETMTARWAAERATAEDIAALESHLADMRAATNDSDFHDADVQFHEALAQATGNPILVFFFQGIAGLVRELRIRATQGRRQRGESFEGVNSAHAAILAAIAGHNPDGAESAMSAHLTQVEEGLAAYRAPRRRK